MNTYTLSTFIRLLSLLLLITTIPSIYAHAQLTYKKYWVSLKDKTNTPYTINQPTAFLSTKAIERRKKYQIPIQTNDLPVDPVYVNQIKALGGTILYTSRWFNAVAVQVEDSTTLEQIQTLSFVQQTQAVSKYKQEPIKTPTTKPFRLAKSWKRQQKGEIYYGAAFRQIHMVNGDYLHAQGYTGEGMTVAVMDAGFSKVNELEAFRHLFDQKRILGTFDFVTGQENVYQVGTHGTQVLSIMAAYQPGTYVGTAPNANYYLFRTEDGRSETVTEEYNWVAAAEYADSVGVDVINTSLGYCNFDDPTTSYKYEHMDGNTSRITIGADIAASKGILVVSSAGNKGNKSWRYITAPADGDSVLAVGSVNAFEMPSSFSSYGPTVDGRIKPNIAGMGELTELIAVDGVVRRSNGTSYAAPLIAGLVTCLWQANPTKTNADIIRLLEQNASQHKQPNDRVGYGVPDFKQSLQNLMTTVPTTLEHMVAFVYPNPFLSQAKVYYRSEKTEQVQVELYSSAGQLLNMIQEPTSANKPYQFTFNWDVYPKGVYLIKIKNSHQTKILRAVKMGR